ncbi:MAG: hypothetical protein K6E21_04195 [Bacilli bacterium]|nr:hypothetical protein [Bacilli bacterium]
MKITRELNEFLKMFLKMEGKDAVEISLIPHECGGKGLDLHCVKLENRDYVDYDGLKVIISKEDDEVLTHYILDADDKGGVAISMDTNYAHQCGCGHHGDCSCGEENHTCSCGGDCSCKKDN